jgi:hypothetical protein
MKALWFYCEPVQAYFPYAASCQEQWVGVPAVAPPNAHQEQQHTAAIDQSRNP